MQIKKVIISVSVLGIIGAGVYYAFLNKNSTQVAPLAPSTDSATQKTPNTALTVAVSISNFSFVPTVLTIKKGTKVTWTNNDSAPHTVTSDAGNLLHSQTLATGQSFSFIFTETGTVNYHCSVHPGMTGKVIVQ